MQRNSSDPIAGLAAVIIALSFGSTLALILMNGSEGWIVRSLRFFATTILAMMMIRRIQWSRILLGVSHVVSSLALIIGLFTVGLRMGLYWTVWFPALAALYGHLAYQILFSKKISEAFQRAPVHY